MARNCLSLQKKNIRAHYDVGNDFYSVWLDRSMIYSSALYLGDDSLGGSILAPIFAAGRLRRKARERLTRKALN
jgi:cyclopropane fatty-acyl-phospholipid synthase-like methyltransferase